MLLVDNFQNVIRMMLFGNKDKNQEIPIPKDAQGNVLGNGHLYTDLLESNRENPTIKPFQENREHTITSTFGRRDGLNNRAAHAGIDICFKSKAFALWKPPYNKPPLFAPIDGEIKFNKDSSVNFVRIIDKDGNEHGLLHMDVVFVQNGQQIKQGDLVGIIGGIGKSLSEIDNKQVDTIYNNLLELQKVNYLQVLINCLRKGLSWKASIEERNEKFINRLEQNGIEESDHRKTLLEFMERKDLGDKKEQIIKNEIIRFLRNIFGIHLHYQILDSEGRVLNPAVFWNTAYKIKETHCDEQGNTIQVDNLDKIYEYSYDKNSNLLEIKTPKSRRFFPYYTSEEYYTIHTSNKIKENLGLYYTIEAVDSSKFKICEYFLQIEVGVKLKNDSPKRQIFLYRRYKDGIIDSKNKDKQDSYNNWFQNTSGVKFSKVDVELEPLYYQCYKREGILGQAPEQSTENPDGTVTLNLTLSNQRGLLQDTPIYIYSYFHHKLYESKTDENGILRFCLQFEESNKSFTLALHHNKGVFNNMDTSDMVGNIPKITIAPSHIQNKEYIGYKTIQDIPQQESESNIEVEIIQNMPYDYYFGDIDLRGKVRWRTQFDEEFGDKDEQRKACKKACNAIIKQLGIKWENPNNDGKVAYQVAIERDVEYINNAYKQIKPKFNKESPPKQDDYMMIYEKVFKDGLEYLDDQLEQGYPVIVGVDHTYGNTYNNDKSTDHFVVIVGRKYDKQGKLYYLFYEVGVGDEERGASDGDANRLYLESNALRSKTSHRRDKKKYFVTQIRKNIK